MSNDTLAERLREVMNQHLHEVEEKSFTDEVGGGQILTVCMAQESLEDFLPAILDVLIEYADNNSSDAIRYSEKLKADGKQNELPRAESIAWSILEADLTELSGSLSSRHEYKTS